MASSHYCLTSSRLELRACTSCGLQLVVFQLISWQFLFGIKQSRKFCDVKKDQPEKDEYFLLLPKIQAKD